VSSHDIEAVLFDWGGTLTAWHNIDFEAEARALALAVSPGTTDLGADEVARALMSANQTVWNRSRDHQQSAGVSDIFAEAGLAHDPQLLGHYYDFWEPHTFTDEAVGPLFENLRQLGIKVGVLSNTLWPRSVHVGFFERDGVCHLIDGDVYTSEVSWTKPSPHVFRAALDAVGAVDPARCVYVGDRLFDDIWGAQSAGLRTIYVPHSEIPVEQVGHTLGTPDATVHSLSEVLDVINGWSLK
jgi:putative hydrolase of the HAD superfamily